MKEFTLEELGGFNGQNGSPVYVAYEGKVYDLSDSSMWDSGDHEGMHWAGADLTSEHDDAPHDVLITGFPQVGVLV
ncbi:MAG TPA: cytochrome b5 domain-containing protein [Coriobacteriia bacterium]|nr:cytochrome b5 domain-containing protein [Coriobacteriia bacterium]